MLPKILKTLYGDVFLVAFCKHEKGFANHRERIAKILSEAAGFDVGALIAKDGERPVFENSPFNANWSHSENLCVLAYSKNALVGIDAEWIRPRNLRVAERFFHQEEWAAICAEQGREPDDGKACSDLFFKLWCRKEAYFKCVGGSFFTDSLAVNMLGKFPNGVQCAEWKIEFEGKLFRVTLAVDELRNS